jgi:cytochrome c-type biogenesis protein CcmH
MTSVAFWAVAAALAGLVALVLVRAMQRGGGGAHAAGAEADVAVYKDQLAEIERDLGRGTIPADEAARLRVEVGRRLLEADRSLTAAKGVVPAQESAAKPWGVLGLIGVVIIGGGLVTYDQIGAPGYPDLGLKPRLAELDSAIAARPSQAAELERLGITGDPAAEAALAATLATETDATALRSAFADRFTSGQSTAARQTAERLLQLLGDKAAAGDHVSLALALVGEAQGYVSPEAEAALRDALRLDMTNEVARYLVGEMFVQGGRFDQAFKFWRPILETGTPEAPWVASIRDRIGMVATLAGIKYEVPGAPGPDAAQMADAATMSPEDRKAMIEGMVGNLSARLAQEGGTIEEWERLIRSLAVLERLPEAQAIYDEAKVKFEGRPAELSFLRMAAVESGLNP